MNPSPGASPFKVCAMGLAMLAAVFFGTEGSSAQITWGLVTTIAADTDVITNGTFMYAYGWANNNETINGVTFSGTASTGGAAPNVGIAVSTGSILNNS